MPWRNTESYLAIGAAARVFGTVLLVLGSVVPVAQLVIGVELANVDWLLFVIVGGFGFALLVVGRALGRRYQVGPTLENGYQAAGEPGNRTQDHAGDGGGGDAGD